MLGAFSGAYGAAASGGGKRDIFIGGGVGAGLSLISLSGGLTSKILENPYGYSVISNIFGQFTTYYFDKNDFKFNSISIAGSAVAPAFSQNRVAAIAMESNPITRTMLEALYETPINAIAIPNQIQITGLRA
jgi:hypothetical protein